MLWDNNIIINKLLLLYYYNIDCILNATKNSLLWGVLYCVLCCVIMHKAVHCNFAVSVARKYMNVNESGNYQ